MKLMGTLNRKIYTSWKDIMYYQIKKRKFIGSGLILVTVNNAIQACGGCCGYVLDLLQV